MQKSYAAWLLAALASFTFLALAQEKDKEAVSYSDLNVAQIAGRQLFDLKKCADCHTLAEKAEGEKTPVNDIRNNDWFAQHVAEESPVVLREEKSKRKQRRVLQDEIQALDEFLYNTATEQRQKIESMPDSIAAGAYLVYQNNCLNCHAVAGLGRDVAPDLSKVGNRHDKAWFIANLKDPKQFKEDTIMPPFNHLPEADLEKIADYLETLK